MSSRRKFIRNSATGLAGVAIVPGTFIDLVEIKDYAAIIIGIEKGHWEGVRDLFPLSHSRAYLNTGTMGPPSYKVLETVGRWNTKVATTGNYNGYEPALERIAEFVGAQKEEIALTHSTTEGINVVAQGLQLKKGDQVIMTDHEHVGGALPWLSRGKRDGIVLKTFTPARTEAENIERISELITGRTKVIAVPHITCTTGIRLPIKQIAALAKEKGLITAIDGAHGPGSMDLDLVDLGVDVYVACCHKWLCGPGGSGFIFVRQEVQDRIDPVFVGAMSDTGWRLDNEEQSIASWNNTAHRYFYGTQSASIFQGVMSAMDMMNDIGTSVVQKRILHLSGYLTELRRKSDLPIEFLSADEEGSRSGMVGFRLLEVDYQHVFEKAMLAGFRIRMVPESGLNSLRISTHIYNNEKELESFVAFLKSL